MVELFAPESATCLWGYCTPNLKLGCFVLYFKIINTFLKIIYASSSKFSKKLKNGIGILVGTAVFKLWITTVKLMFLFVAENFA